MKWFSNVSGIGEQTPIAQNSFPIDGAKRFILDLALFNVLDTNFIQNQRTLWPSIVWMAQTWDSVQGLGRIGT